jgi:hypothetical protein
MDLPTQLAKKAARKIMLALDSEETQTQETFATIIDKETKLPQWKAALEGLTPSGSEFVDDPERCQMFVKNRLDSGHMMLMDSLRRCKAIETALVPIMARLAPESTAGTLSQDVFIQASEIDALRAALAPPKVTS